MKIFYRGETVIATHPDDQPVDASIYGDDILTKTVPDDTVLERIGLAPADPRFDTRPYKVPNVQAAPVSRDQAKAQVVSIINEFSNTLMGGYPQSEMLSWGTKDLAARAYLAGEKLNESQELLLNTEKEAGGYASIEELCKVIVANSDNFVRISGLVAGIRVTASQGIDRAMNAQEIQAVIDSVKQKLASAAQ